MVPKPRCGNCPYWKSESTEGQSEIYKEHYAEGNCIFFPPTPVSTTWRHRDGCEPSYGTGNLWSATRISEVCGQHPNFLKWHEQELAKLSEGDK